MGSCFSSLHKLLQGFGSDETRLAVTPSLPSQVGADAPGIIADDMRSMVAKSSQGVQNELRTILLYAEFLLHDDEDIEKLDTHIKTMLAGTSLEGKGSEVVANILQFGREQVKFALQQLTPESIEQLRMRLIADLNDKQGKTIQDVC